MDESIKSTPGFRFNPFEEELITFYLKPKVLGHKLPCNVVEERQLYGPHANPWQVFDPENHSWILSEATPRKFEKVTYVFVNLTKMASVEREKKHGRDNYMKKAGCGTWGGKSSRSEIRDHCNGDVIGERRLLVFQIDEDTDQDLSKAGYWKMHEYSLRGVNQNISNPRNIVLCKITFDCSRHPVTESSPSDQLCTRYPKPVSSDFCWPAKYGNDYKKIVKEEQSVEDTTRNLGKEKFKAETSCSMTKKVKPVSSNFCWPVKHNNDYPKIKKEAGEEREDLDSGMTKVQISSYPKPKEEQSVEDTPTNLGKRKVKV